MRFREARARGAGGDQQVASGGPVDAARVDAYWKRLGDLFQAFGVKMLAAEPDRESVPVRLKKATAAFEDLADAVRAEPPAGVDPAQAAFAGHAAQTFRAMARLFTKIGRLAEERQALAAQANPTAPEVEVLLSLLSNGPSAKGPAAGDGARRLDAKGDALLAELDALQAAWDKVEAEEAAVRSHLAAAYGRVFSPLTPRRDPRRNAYSEAEYAAVRASWAGKADEWGRGLLKETHPTGEFRAADLDAFEPTKDREGFVAVVRCRWEGGITKAKYVTRFRAVVDKRQGLLELTVAQDTAVISIAAPNLLAAQAKLKDAIRLMR